MKILTFEQRTPEWYFARRGVFTASDFGPFLIGTDKKSEQARQNFIDTKIGEIFDGDDIPPDYQDFWMKRGTKLEPEALAAYTARTGIETSKVGFVLHDNELLGCSPDAMLVDQGNAGLEMKCPSGKIQHKRLRENIIPTDYLYQIHGSMVITGADCWHYWSWHPKMPALHLIERRSTLTEQLDAALLRLCDEMRKQYRNLVTIAGREDA